jgi:undecaprenyl-diphosphatase
MRASREATPSMSHRRAATRHELLRPARTLLTSPHRPLAVALLVAAAGVVAFARVTEDYLTNDPLARWDVSLAGWLAEHRSPLGVDVFRVVTDVGSPVGCLAAAAVVAVFLARRKRLLDAALLAVAFVGAQVLDLALKLTFHRERPEFGVVHLDTYSYPSGHAMTATAVWGALAYVLWRRTTSRRARAAIALALVVIVAAVAGSRVYLGVHYLSDVLGGITAGTTWVALVIALRAAADRRSGDGRLARS